MGYIRGEAREQVTMFPVTLDELIPSRPHVSCDRRVRGTAELAKLDFVRAEAAETGRPGYDPTAIC